METTQKGPFKGDLKECENDLFMWNGRSWELVMRNMDAARYMLSMYDLPAHELAKRLAKLPKKTIKHKLGVEWGVPKGR